MKVKDFFKSTAFKCIAVLLGIVLICTVFLTICNSLFYVSDEERFERAINKIYGKPVTTSQIDLEGQKTEYAYSTINSAYLVEDDGNYLVNVSGKQGHGGDIVCWVVVAMKEGGKEIDGIYKVEIGGVPSGEFTNKISAGDLARFTADYKDGVFYEYGFKNDGNQKGDMYISTGASESMRAISNAVNGALDFVKAYALGEVSLGYYEALGFDYIDYINQDVSLTGYTVADGVVTYNITTLGNSPAGAFKLQITVGADKTIASYSVVANGSTAGYGNSMADVAAAMTGKSLSEVEILIAPAMTDGKYDPSKEESGNAINTGATKSNFLCYYAGAFALANYDKCIENPMTGGDAQ